MEDKPPETTPDNGNDRALLIDPDLEFIEMLGFNAGGNFKKCIQCGTCSGTCTLTPDVKSFPCKEMSWATWGMKDRLRADLDVWLCYQCNDCSARCPRGARPGDVLGAIRREVVREYSFPSFMAKWSSEPQSLLLMLGLPIALLAAMLYFRAPLEEALGIVPDTDSTIVYAYSAYFPQWMLNLFFGFFTVVTFLIAVAGVSRFWSIMEKGQHLRGRTEPVMGRWQAIYVGLKKALTHEHFGTCEKSHSRIWSHALVMFGFAALTAVTLWVITAPYNPLIKNAFVYPFAFLSPWKILANVGGLAALFGVCVMGYERVVETDKNAQDSFSDWALIGAVIAVLVSGFATEALHYVRLEPHRHLVYFAHLVFVFALLMYLPYSKLAHILYRTTALVFAERYGRKIGIEPAAEPEIPVIEREEVAHVAADSQ